MFERFEVVIAYFALVNLGRFSKHFISFQKLPIVIFRSHCSTVVYKWNWNMYVCMCVYPSWVSIYLCSPEVRQITSLRASTCETHFFKIYISKMWEEDGLNFLDNMLSTSRLSKLKWHGTVEQDDQISVDISMEVFWMYFKGKGEVVEFCSLIGTEGPLEFLHGPEKWTRAGRSSWAAKTEGWVLNPLPPPFPPTVHLTTAASHIPGIPARLPRLILGQAHFTPFVLLFRSFVCL